MRRCINLAGRIPTFVTDPSGREDVLSPPLGEVALAIIGHAKAR
jgi:hypothetical protein